MTRWTLVSDPNRPGEPFNRLCDTARARGFKVGLRAGDNLIGPKGAERRHIAAIECKTPAKILVEPLDHRGLQAAAHGLLARLPEVTA